MADGSTGAAHPGFSARGGMRPRWHCSSSGSPDRRSEKFLSTMREGYLPCLQIDCALKPGGPLPALFMPDFICPLLRFETGTFERLDPRMSRTHRAFPVADRAGTCSPAHKSDLHPMSL